MSAAATTARPHVWMDGLGEWRWPGRGGAAVEALPPSWVPAMPPQLAYPAAPSPAAELPASWDARRATTRRLRGAALLGALSALGLALTPNAPARVMDALGLQVRVHQTAGALATRAPSVHAPPVPALPVPSLSTVSHDAAGSAIDAASYRSLALHTRGSFHVYLPPGFPGTGVRYPMLYLLHGTGERDTSFLQIGLQGMLDRLIARHAVPPMIAVMIQGGPGTNLWRDHGTRGYESYILEVQEMLDRALPTVADRAGRAIAGYSMGGYGAMGVVLDHPERFAAVESWLGFFVGLEGELRASRPVLSRFGLHAFLYGGASDRLVDPMGNSRFAAGLRAAGASAQSAVYPGDHSLQTLHAHLGSMLVYAGRALSGASPPAS